MRVEGFPYMDMNRRHQESRLCGFESLKHEQNYDSFTCSQDSLPLMSPGNLELLIESLE